MVSTASASVQVSGLQYLPPADVDLKTSSPNQFLLPLTAQVNSRDRLEIGGCDVVDLVQRFGSPLYILDEDTLRAACAQYREAFQRYYPGKSQVVFASKAWNCLATCAIAASEGLGVEGVSGGEIYTALKAGVPIDRLYFHGNNKSRDELQLAADAGCTIMIDNWLEIELLNAIATQVPHGRSADNPIPIMIRLTPGIECHTHEYIRTGHLDSKFGFDPNQLDRVFRFLCQQPALRCVGLHAHIGSQIFELQPHHDLAAVMVEWLQQAKSYGLPAQMLNVGGGLGIRYTEDDDPPSIDDWAKTVGTAIADACKAQNLEELPTLLCEPGRSLVGSACVTAYRVGSRKEIPDIRTYLSVDGGMSDNPRPITYQSLYRAAIADRMSAPFMETVTVAGKHCESGDIVLQAAQLPHTQPGDTIVVMGTGAYNYSMASNYNRLPRPAAVLVKDGEANIFLKRETYHDLLRQDCLPSRLVSEDG